MLLLIQNVIKEFFNVITIQLKFKDKVSDFRISSYSCLLVLNVYTISLRLRSSGGNYCILLLSWESFYFMAFLSFYFRCFFLHFTRPLSTPRIFTPRNTFVLCTFYIFIWKYSLLFPFLLTTQLFTLKLAIHLKIKSKLFACHWTFIQTFIIGN